MGTPAENQRYYQRNKQYHLDRKNTRKDKIRDYVRAKKNVPCTDCGARYPYYVMHFDHLRDKKVNLGNIAATGWSLERIDEELNKCEVVCANCHAERTYKRSLV